MSHAAMDFKVLHFMVLLICVLSFSSAYNFNCFDKTAVNQCHVDWTRMGQISLEARCTKLDNQIECLKSYANQCLSAEDRNQLMSSMAGAIDSFENLCKNDTARQEIQKHQDCLSKGKKCVDQLKTIGLDGTVSSMDTEETLTKKVKTMCKGLRKFIKCIDRVTSRKCNKESRVFVLKQFQKITEPYLQNQFCKGAIYSKLRNVYKRDVSQTGDHLGFAGAVLIGQEMTKFNKF